ncbi:SagB/ThcOx family dehydrogenase [Garciella nitratireducens]|uniref:SagB/ThcOx family dehydrogenase n=1 Tax=Garciella nitratireducens TaxID=218205 RepID=UPI001BD60E47|nr:SagB/ThcOx family dehydrogenase [Garciella nitratireducens]
MKIENIKKEVIQSNFPRSKTLQSDESQGVRQPFLQKPYDEKAKIIELPEVGEEIVQKLDVYQCLKERRSVRKYAKEDITLKQLSFLLWATQGVEKMVGKNKKTTYRTVPSGGGRHPFETYLVINQVQELDKGLYRYLPLEHKLLQIQVGDFSNQVAQNSMGQKYIENAAVVFIWSVVPYRTEWRYTINTPKLVLLDAGHVCQNLYIACEAIGCGTCAVACYDQEKMDQLIGVDGQEEFTIYLAPVGKRI